MTFQNGKKINSEKRGFQAFEEDEKVAWTQLQRKLEVISKEYH